MRVDQTAQDGVVVLALSGRLLAGLQTYRLHQRIRELVEKGHRNVLLDLAGVTAIDSAGLALLIAGHFTLTRNGGALRVCGISERVRQVMSVCLTRQVIETYPSRDHGLAAIGRAAAN